MRLIRRLVLASTVLTCASIPAAAQTQAWAKSFGTPAADRALTCAPDGSGGAFVGGYTWGSFAAPLAGLYDVVLARHDGAGNTTWVRQFGSTSGEMPHASVSDGAGGVYLGGSAIGSFAGPSAGGQDAWLARFDGAGNQLWLQQFGTGQNESLSTAAPDGSGGAFVAGSGSGGLGGSAFGASDVWIAHYDSAGNQTWVRALGSAANDYAHAAAPDGAGGFYLGGESWGDLGGPNAGSTDAWLARFDSAGNPLWIRQLGTTGGDGVSAAAADGTGGVFFGGTTGGVLATGGGGLGDAWFARYDAAGNQLWIRQLGSTQHDSLDVAASGGFGAVIVGGSTLGTLGGGSAGASDLWLARFDAAGAEEWVAQYGSSAFDWVWAAASDGGTGILVSGATNGDFGGSPLGSEDAWVARFGESCTFAPTVYCTAKPNSLGCTPAIAMLSALKASSDSAGTVVTTNIVGGMVGIYFHGTAGASSTPFHGGFLCVQAPLQRHALQNSGGTPGTCTGSFSESFNAYIASGVDPSLVAGGQAWIQNWSRDPAAPFGDGLSDAVTATICP